MTSSSTQVKTALRDLMVALGAWTRDVGAFWGYVGSYGYFVVGRNYAKLTKMPHKQMVKRFPKPKPPESVKADAPALLPAETTRPQPAPMEQSKSGATKPAGMKPEQTKPGAAKPVAMKPEQSASGAVKPAEMRPESSANKVISGKEPAPVAKAVPKKPPQVKTAESVVPPNIERAINGQLRASGKDRMTFDEMMSVMTALGVGPAEASNTLQLFKAQTKREHVVLGDLTQIQGWISKGWILTKRRQYRHFDIAVREQFGLELNAPLHVESLAAELMRRGFTQVAATDVATKLITRDWL